MNLNCHARRFGHRKGARKTVEKEALRRRETVHSPELECYQQLRATYSNSTLQARNALVPGVDDKALKAYVLRESHALL
jgi:hypothetical protein